MDISYEELRLIERIGKALELDNERVGRTPHVKLIKMLLDEIDILEFDNKVKQETLDGIENYIERMR